MAGDYSVRVKAVLDVGSIKAQLDALSKSGLNIDASKATKELENVQKQAGLVGDSVTKATKKGSDGFKGLKGYISEGTRSFGDITKKVMLFGAATNVINGAAQGAKAMVGSVFELDDSLTEFKKVSDISGESLDRFVEKAYDVGTEVARTGTEVIDASTEFKKMGYTVNESLDLARVATMFQNVADTEISAADAANFINSQMKAFNFTATESEHIIDAVNQVANEFAVGTNDLSGALTVAGSSLATTGNSFEQTIGLITSATEMMPGKAQTVGNSFRTIGINIAAMADSTDTWVAANGRVNVALKDSQGNLRSTYDIMKDLYTGVEGQSVAWNELSEAEQNAIAVQAGGKTRYQAFVASMSNFDAAIRSTETAMNSQGSAARENANAIDSLEGHINALKSAFQKFATSLISSDLLKTLVDIGTAILNFAAGDVGQAILKLTLLGIAIGVAVRAFNKLHAVVKGMSVLEGISALWFGIGDGAKDAAEGVDDAARSMSGATKKGGSLVSSLNKIIGKLSPMGFGLSIIGAGLVGMGTALYSVYKDTHQYTRAVDDMIKANNKNIESVKTNYDQAQLYIDKIDELSKVENKNTYQKQLMAQYVEKLNELYPGLNLEYDESTDTLSQNTDELRRNTEEAYKNAQAKAYQENAENALQEKIKAENKAEKKAPKIQGFLDQLSGMDKGSKLYNDTLVKLNKQVAKYKDALNAADEAQIEYTKNMNAQATQTDDYKTVMQQYEKEVGQIPSTLKEKIKDGLISAPLTKEDWDTFIQFDGLVSAFERTGKKLPNSIYAGIQEGIYSVPTDSLNLEQLVTFDSAMTHMKSHGAELSDEMIKGLYNEIEAQEGDVQKEYNDILSRMLKVTDPEDLLQIGDILADETMTIQEKMSTIEGIMNGIDVEPLHIDSTISDDIDDIRSSIENLPEDTDLTITAQDDASGTIKDVQISADELANGKYIAELIGVDHASAVVEYAQAVAGGYEGTYTAWLVENGGDEAINKMNNAKLAGENFDGEYVGEVRANNGQALGSIGQARAQGTIWQGSTFTGRVAAKDDASGTIQRLKNTYAGKTIATAAIRIKTTVDKAGRNAKGKRKGVEGGLSWLGDEGSRSNPKPELVQTKDGAFLAGTTGWEMYPLDKDDIVYSNAETRRLLGDRGLSITSSVIPRYASGTPKFLDANSDNESIKKKIDAWSDSLDTWKHNLDTGRVTEEQYINWLKSQYKLSNKMTQDQYRDAEKTIFDYYATIEEAALQNYITELEYGNESLDSMLDRINKAYKAQKINDEQVKDLREDAYKAFMEYNLKMLENEEATYGDVLKVIEDFYKQGKISADDYYGYLEDASNAAKDAETERLEKLQEEQENQQELAKLYAQLQVDNIDKQIEALEKQNEAQEKANELAELYNNLAKARQQKVKVFRNGQWVYEEDRDAIKEAQDAINDFNAEHATDELEKLKEEWQAILDMFDDQETLAEIKDLENALGKTAEELFGFMGTDLSAWTEWFKNTLATGMGIEDILTELEGLEGFEKISEYLDSEGHVDWNAIEQAIKNNRFASGTLNAPGGLSIVGEKGWELRALNKGDAIFPHDISENLMRWGAITPSDFKAKDTESIVQSFNFDKLVLPNVRNADDFVAELKKLPNLAIQRANGRY